MNFSTFSSIHPQASSAQCEAYQKVLLSFENIKTHPENWAIESVTPDDTQYQAALAGLQRLFKTDSPAPSLMLLNDGVIGAYWRKNEHYASIDFDIDGAYPWAVSNQSSVKGDIWDSEQLPAELIQFFDILGNSIS